MNEVEFKLPIRKKAFKELSFYFVKIPNFKLLPTAFQTKMIKFFLEDRHYMVDPSDVKDFLESGSQFTLIVTLNDLVKCCKNNKPNGILACKRVWTSIEWFSRWMDKVNSLGKHDSTIIYLTHVFEFPSDKADEWYIASY